MSRRFKYQILPKLNAVNALESGIVKACLKDLYEVYAPARFAFVVDTLAQILSVQESQSGLPVIIQVEGSRHPRFSFRPMLDDLPQNLKLFIAQHIESLAQLVGT